MIMPFPGGILVPDETSTNDACEKFFINANVVKYGWEKNFEGEKKNVCGSVRFVTLSVSFRRTYSHLIFYLQRCRHLHNTVTEQMLFLIFLSVSSSTIIPFELNSYGAYCVPRLHDLGMDTVRRQK